MPIFSVQSLFVWCHLFNLIKSSNGETVRSVGGCGCIAKFLIVAIFIHLHWVAVDPTNFDYLFLHFWVKQIWVSISVLRTETVITVREEFKNSSKFFFFKNYWLFFQSPGNLFYIMISLEAMHLHWVAAEDFVNSQMRLISMI